MPHLLLPRSVHLLKVMEVLVDARTVGEGFQDPRHRRPEVRVEGCLPAVVRAPRDDADQVAAGEYVARNLWSFLDPLTLCCTPANPAGARRALPGLRPVCRTWAWDRAAWTGWGAVARARRAGRRPCGTI